jgi:hypothetical protein
MDIDTSRTRRLHRLLAGAPRNGAGNRYPDDLRREVVVVFEEARAEGTSMDALAAALGLPVTTLSRWSLEAPRRGGLLRVDNVPVAPLPAAVASAPIVDV